MTPHRTSFRPRPRGREPNGISPGPWASIQGSPRAATLRTCVNFPAAATRN